MAHSRQSNLGRKFAIATAEAKKLGFKNFKPGSPGDKKRKEIAEAVARKLNGS